MPHQKFKLSSRIRNLTQMSLVKGKRHVCPVKFRADESSSACSRAQQWQAPASMHAPICPCGPPRQRCRVWVVPPSRAAGKQQPANDSTQSAPAPGTADQSQGRGGPSLQLHHVAALRPASVARRRAACRPPPPPHRHTHPGTAPAPSPQAEQRAQELQAANTTKLELLAPSQRQAAAALTAERTQLTAEAARLEAAAGQLDQALGAAEGELGRSDIKRRALELQASPGRPALVQGTTSGGRRGGGGGAVSKLSLWRCSRPPALPGTRRRASVS